jgi:hypothetical protein
MKYSADIKQKQYLRVSEDRKIFISPDGGEITDKDIELIKKSPYGKRLIETGALTIEEAQKLSQPVLPAAPEAAEGKHRK